MGLGARQVPQSIFSLENQMTVDCEDILMQASLFYRCEAEDQEGKRTSQGHRAC